jgi:DNA end-binding protein Ku
MRSIWTGSIGFGLVNIPIKMYSAVHESELDLDMLDKKDHANIKFQRVNANTGKEVTWQNIVRGYKVDDRYVVLTEKDFERASPEKTKIIEIVEFVNEKDIDSIYYESFYYLEPEKTGAKAYALLRDALKETGKAGLGSYVLRNRESLALIKVFGDVLILNKLRFQQEIRPVGIKLPKTKSTRAELKIAEALIAHLSGKFDISKYNDTYSQKLLKLINAKAKGKTVAAKPVRTPSRAKNLMSQLRASLQSSKSSARRHVS